LIFFINIYKKTPRQDDEMFLWGHVVEAVGIFLGLGENVYIPEITLSN